jgi:hypothetical protein
MLMIVLKKGHTGRHCFDCAPLASEAPNTIPKTPPSTTWITMVSPGEWSATRRRPTRWSLQFSRFSRRALEGVAMA